MNTDLSHKISQVDSFIDEAFDLRSISDFQLILQIGNDGLFVTVLDKQKNKFIAFEYYSFQHAVSFDVVADLLELAIGKSKIIPHRYPSVSCSIVNNLSTLVPNVLYEDDRKKLYLKFNASLQGDEMIFADDIKTQEAKNVFAIPLSIKTKLDTTFGKVQYHHFSSGLIDKLLSQNKNNTKKQLYVHVEASHFETILVEGNKLLFYNTFTHHTAEDFIYYLLFACEQLNLNPENIETILIGEIERTSTIYTIAQKYIRNLKFGDRNDTCDFSYQLQTFPKHFYYSLFNNYLA